MALLSIQKVALKFDGPLLLDGVSFQIERGERVCLLGRNGEGKSTLMKILAGSIEPDSGNLVCQQGLWVTLLDQEVPQGLGSSVFDVVAEGLGRRDNFLSLEGGHRVEEILSRMGLEGKDEFDVLSAGVKRRVLLAKALVCNPDLLLLDEPTNHLDIEAISWLEDFLLRHVVTMMFVTHDRMFLRKLSTRIIELDRGNLSSWSCDYDSFLERKQAILDAEANQRAIFEKRLAQEEIWIRQGIKARRTRAQARVRALGEMREIRRVRREREGSVRLQLQDIERSGKLVVEVDGVGFSYGGQPIVRDLSTLILRGDKVGIIGPNGSGKTTLLRLLLGELRPQQGAIRLGTRLEIAYFDQLRAQLDEQNTVEENVGDGKHLLTINGKQRHIISYLQDFLFSPERSRSPVWQLSGGERNRLLLARMFTKPSNLLVLDEPTNDLDVETLELLEELLVNYSGTLLLVSHDRAFLNSVVTSTLVLEGEGQVKEYVGGYDDWLRQCQREPLGVAKTKNVATKPARPCVQNTRPRGLSYKQQQELEALPERIELLEAEKQQLYETMGDSALYQQQDGDDIVRVKTRLESVEKELVQAYNRWDVLEKLLDDISLIPGCRPEG